MPSKKKTPAQAVTTQRRSKHAASDVPAGKSAKPAKARRRAAQRVEAPPAAAAPVDVPMNLPVSAAIHEPVSAPGRRSTDAAQPSSITLKLDGRRLDTSAAGAIPALLRPGRATRDVRRSAGSSDQAGDDFLPESYLKVVAAVDLTVAPSRSVDGQAAVPDVLDVQPGQLLLLETVDGLTLLTTGPQLQHDLHRLTPGMQAGDGALDLQALATRSARLHGDEGATRGLLSSLGGLVSRVFVLDRGAAAAADPITTDAVNWLLERGEGKLADALQSRLMSGASYLGAKALCWAVEKQLLKDPGLYRWGEAGDGSSELQTPSAADLAQAAQEGPLLVFIHGTASNTLKGFGDLREGAARRDWETLAVQYPKRIFALEHRTFSDSPLDNALLLLQQLPANATVDLVTHSRGGIVGDLLCVDWRDGQRLPALAQDFRRVAVPANADAKDGFAAADQSDRKTLAALMQVGAAKGIRVRRYVRVAAPANGTLLLSGNLDVFLSVLLSLLGTATGWGLTPHYQAIKRLFMDLIRQRANANVVPGLEAMLPMSASARFLAQAPTQGSVQLGVIAGDIEIGSRLSFKRLIEFFTDWTFFERHEHDLVVDTDSMDAGIAPRLKSPRLLVQGPQVDHFSYFANRDSRDAMTAWLTVGDVKAVAGFEVPAQEPAAAVSRAARAAQATRGAQADQDKPVLIVLPGVMGSYLGRGQGEDYERYWTGLSELFFSETLKLAYDRLDPDEVVAEKLVTRYYDDLCDSLEASHLVRRFAYDWRRPVQDSAVRLAKELKDALQSAGQHGQPVRILAHSMGGLVVRALAAAEPLLWKRFLDQPAARLVFLGTPNQGTHATVGMLMGRHEMIRLLAAGGGLLQPYLDLVAGCPGPLQLLPRREFIDDAEQVDAVADYADPRLWPNWAAAMVDETFGDGLIGKPTEATLAPALALWQLEGFEREAPALPGVDAALSDKVIMVYGQAPETPIGTKTIDGRLYLVMTSQGDGTVPWVSSRIGGVGHHYLMDAAHGDMCREESCFEDLVALLNGKPPQRLQALPQGQPQVVGTRSGAAPALVLRSASPTGLPTEDSLLRAALGGAVRVGTAKGRARRRAWEFRISCSAMDVRDALSPMMVGHYERDPIAGAEKVIDQDVVEEELSLRNDLGLYAGPVGTATIVLMPREPGEHERGTQRGAVVAGLGEMGQLTASLLREAARAAALRYLLRSVEDQEAARALPREQGEPGEPLSLRLASLMIGQNSSTNISISDSVTAIVRGVLDANQRFGQARERDGRQSARIVALEFVDRHLDVAITATRVLRQLAQTLNREGSLGAVKVLAAAQVFQHESMQPRLEVSEGMGYWARLSVTGMVGDKTWTRAEAEKTGSAPVADRLRYVYQAQRARAEATPMQRQPGVIERFVAMSIHDENYREDIARALFQLMVPIELKETLRQVENLVLLVDAYTANFPWELMVADERPLILDLSAIRQFETQTWRQQVRASVARNAYVVGNPSVNGFAKAFKLDQDPVDLAGAEEEAGEVVACLEEAAYAVHKVIGRDKSAVDVIQGLYRQPYRIVHIAAHGDYGLKAAGSDVEVGGVVLSDGLMLTAAEIRQMEIVPDLVFLNCCHLGQVDKPAGAGRRPEFNRLAASLARELIEMGVRAVVAAGWAVHDKAGNLFAQTFYRGLLQQNKAFGTAIRDARRQVHDQFPKTNTWGAYQAYGDPGFVMDPLRARAAGGGGRQEKFVAPEEAVADLDRLFADLKRASGRKRLGTLARLQAAIKRVLDRCQDDWGQRGDIHFATACIYARFGAEGFAKAIEHLHQAVADSRATRGGAPLRSIEQLANYEVRLGGQSDAGALLRGAERIQGLVKVLANDPLGDLHPTPERCGLIGGAWKKQARRLALQQRPEAAVPAALPRTELQQALDWYARGAKVAEQGQDVRFCELNRLALALILDESVPEAQLAALETAARQAWAAQRNLYDGLMATDVRVLREIGTPGSWAGPRGQDLFQRYVSDRKTLALADNEWDSAVTQIETLALFASLNPRLNDAAEGLTALAQALRSAPA